MKKCSKCNETKPNGCFHRDSGSKDGLFRWCKACSANQKAAWYAANADRQRELARRYKAANAAELRVKRLDRYAANRDQQVERSRRYRRSNPKKVREGVRKWRRENPEKVAAHSAVQRAVKAGVLTPGVCELCGSKAEAHHEDYSRPLDVRWLCRTHHAARHRESRGAPQW